VRPFRIKKFEIFQRVFEGFIEFLCSSDSKIKLQRAREKQIDEKRNNQKLNR